MNNDIFYTITARSLPAISLCDTANIKPPYIHFKRQAQEYIFYYIHSGELHIREDRREYLLSEGDYILLDPEYLITTTHETHQAIHYGDKNLLLTEPPQRTRNDTCPWKH